MVEIPSHPVRELSISNLTSEIVKVEKWLIEFSNETGLSQQIIFSLDLVLNEALINIISYGYDDDQDRKIHIYIRNFPLHLDVEIIDDARPFNPLKAETTEIAKTIDEASIGGRGILLMKKYCNKINYCYSENKNHLILSINKK